MPLTILLTGANGFIGSHILSQLLTSGHTIHAIVRSPQKATKLLSDFPTSSPRLTTSIVPDITLPGAFNAALSSHPFDAVIHTASPFLYRAVSSNMEFLDPAIKGTGELLRSVKDFGKRVQRVVVTSSCAAIVDFDKEFSTSPRKVYVDGEWNPRSWEDAVGGSPNIGYQASKKFAEKAAWDFMEKEKPNFSLVTLCPPMVYGPLRHSIESVGDLNESNGRIYTLFINSSEGAEIPPNGLHIYTDVRDLAAAHIAAVTSAEAANQRFIISAGRVSSQEIADVLREKIPELEARTPKGIPGAEMDDGLFDVDGTKAKKVLGVTFRSKEESFVELGRQLLEIEGRSK